MRSAVYACLTLLLLTPARAEEETTVRTPQGRDFTVRTDESGTTVSEGTPGGVAVTPTPSEKQHTDRVEDLVRGGGEITSDRNLQR